RALGTSYFGEGQSGERAFASFAQNMVQWKAFGDNRAYDMMLSGTQRHFERNGYDAKDAALKASTLIGQAAADPTFAKLSANAFDQEQMLRNDLTAAQVTVGAMEGRRDYAGDHVAQVERGNVATEQGWRTGSNTGQRAAASMLGLSIDETGRRVSFINALSGEARSSAITQLSRATGRNEAQVMHALESYNAATQVGTADGATAEAAREGTSVYGRTREAAGYDFAERSGKLDAQREVGPDGTRSAARISEQRRQSENFGVAQGAAAAGTSVREAARLDSFIQALSRTAGNQIDMAEGGIAGIADRARNERLGRIVENERLTRMQGLLHDNGVDLTKRQIAMDQNGDLNLNLTPQTAAQMWQAGLINERQLGAIAKGGRARLSFAHNDLLVSSSTGFSQSARSDTSTRFEAGKQAGPDTVEHFLGGGAEGHAMMANWLRGGFEMDRKGEWRLKPQVADTLQRDVQAIMAQTGWTRSLSRSASHQVSNSSSLNINTGGSVESGGERSGGKGRTHGRAGGQVGFETSDVGMGVTDARASTDIVNYDVRNAIAEAERSASRSTQPAETFTRELDRQVLGENGLRNRYLGQADASRGTVDMMAPLTSFEQHRILESGRFSGDRDTGLGDGTSEFKKR
ncbi:MAG: conjugal transfer protein TraG, partial [bacterium]|nr:conjugal transfer protein TraG [bacterium]